MNGYAIPVLAVLLLGSVASADVCRTPGDPPLALVAAGDRLVAGYDSGAVKCFDARLEVQCKARVHGSVTALDIAGDASTIAGTDLGQVACLGADGRRRWAFETTFGVSQVLVIGDRVAVGGADHRVHMLALRDGTELWSRLLVDPESAYVDCLASAGDLNGDGVDDLFVRTWGASRWAISGRDGSDLWNPQPCSRHLSTLEATNDANGDGLRDFLHSGNDGVLTLCSGRDGSEIWRCPLSRPVRAIAADGTGDCFAGTAGGEIVRVRGGNVVWSADIGDVCRKIVLAGDQVIAGAENGVVAAYSANDGKLFWKWQGPDVVRTLTIVQDRIAAACLDGTLALIPLKPGKAYSELPATKTVRPEPIARPEYKPSPAVAEVPVLLYHDIPPKEIAPSESSPLENFRQQMDLLVTEGYTAVSLDDIAGWIEGKRDLPARPVCITFDGHYASHATWLYDILKERGLFAVSYITTDWIGTANHCDWHDLRRLEESGVVLIENHTTNHAFLPAVGPLQVVRQAAGCNEAIRRHLNGKDPKHHTYPDGAYNAAVRGTMAELGFRTATTVLHRRANKSDNLYSIPRYTIFEQTTLDTFKAIIGVQTHPPLPYRFAGTVGANWRQPSYADVDKAGRLWVCNYSASNVRVFLPDGTEAAFSPITTGIDGGGNSMQVLAPSGVAVTPAGEVLISISNRYGTIRYSGIFRYAADGKPLTGWNLPYYPGDLDVDSQGMIYVVDKFTDQWHVYAPDGREISGSPFGENNGLSVCRGIAVTPDGSKVYVLSESSANVRVWEGSASGDSASYSQTGILADRLSSECGGVDVMNDGTVLVGFHDEGMIAAFDSAGKTIGQISGGGIPSLSMPRGTAFTPDGSVLWVICRSGQVQRWEKVQEK